MLTTSGIRWRDRVLLLLLVSLPRAASRVFAWLPFGWMDMGPGHEKDCRVISRLRDNLMGLVQRTLPQE